jgi:ABC-type transport system involved in multi-copper enzyme maturation permease subunit
MGAPRDATIHIEHAEDPRAAAVGPVVDTGLRLTRIELRRNLFSWRASWIYFLPSFLHSSSSFICYSITILRPRLSEDTNILAGIIQLYYIRLGVFFGCLGIFSRLIRGEMIERSLHFYLLSPVRRELLLLAKFAAGSITAIFLFGSAIRRRFRSDV